MQTRAPAAAVSRIVAKSRSGTLTPADVETARATMQAADTKRARRNAKRAAAAAKVGE